MASIKKSDEFMNLSNDNNLSLSNNSISTRISKQEFIINGVTYTYIYTYDNLGNITCIETKNSESSEVIKYSYNYYVEKKQEIESGKKYLEELAGPKDRAEVPVDELSSSEQRRLKKEQEAEERRLKRQQEKAEKRIEELEEQIGEIEAELCKEENMADHKKLQELSDKMNGLKDELAVEYDNWMELQEV